MGKIRLEYGVEAVSNTRRIINTYENIGVLIIIMLKLYKITNSWMGTKRVVDATTDVICLGLANVSYTSKAQSTYLTVVTVLSPPVSGCMINTLTTILPPRPSLA